MNCAFQVSEGSRAVPRLEKLSQIGLPDGRFESRHDRLERLGRCQTKSFDLDLSNCHAFPLIEVNHEIAARTIWRTFPSVMSIMTYRLQPNRSMQAGGGLIFHITGQTSFRGFWMRDERFLLDW
jgi:hypothetical protein